MPCMIVSPSPMLPRLARTCTAMRAARPYDADGTSGTLNATPKATISNDGAQPEDQDIGQRGPDRVNPGGDQEAQRG